MLPGQASPVSPSASIYEHGRYPDANVPSKNETTDNAYQALSVAAAEAAQASIQFIEARTRWANAQAALAEATDRVKRASEAFGI